MKKGKVIGVIPARLGSTRFPGKALIDVSGKPLFIWPVEAAKASKMIDQVIVATDSDEIAEAAQKYNIPYFMNKAKCNCGSERVAEYANHIRQLSSSENDFCDTDYFVNIQADEALLQSWMLDLLLERTFELNSDMATITAPILAHE